VVSPQGFLALYSLSCHQISSLSLNHHLCADDTQLFLSLHPSDGLVEVIGVSCKLLLSDGVSMGWVSSNGSSWQDLGRPQHFMKSDFRIYRQFMHYCLGVQLGLRNLTQLPKALTAPSSILNCAMAKALVRDRRLLSGPGVRTEHDVATVGSLCKELYMLPKLRLAIVEE